MNVERTIETIKGEREVYRRRDPSGLDKGYRSGKESRLVYEYGY